MLPSLHPFARPRPLFATAPLTTCFTQLFNPASTKDNTGWQDGCTLQGFSVGGGDRLHNLGMGCTRTHLKETSCSHRQVR